MKSGIHPKYVPVAITCACGNVIETRSTRPGITVEICSNCHPFFTGKQKIVDAAGRVERFTAKYRNVQPAQKKEAPVPVQPRQVIPKVRPVVPIAAPKPSEGGGPRGARQGGGGRPGVAGGRPGAGPRSAGGRGGARPGGPGGPRAEGAKPAPRAEGRPAAKGGSTGEAKSAEPKP